jgi:hypothetical protein
MRWRLLVAEALAFLVLARLLVAGPPLGWWRRWLGPLATAARVDPPNAADWQLAWVV